MLKFAKYLSFILTFCNLTAETQPLINSHSLYVGTSLSQCSLSGQRSDSVKNDTAEKVTFNNNKRVRENNIYGGILLGYLFRAENFGVGPEFFYNYGKANQKQNYTYHDPLTDTTFYTVSYKISSQAGACVRLGYFFDSYFLYTLVGMHYQTGRFEATADHVDGIPELTKHKYKTKSKRTSTFSYGFGVQKAIAEHYAIGIECKFANIPGKTFTWTLNEPNHTTLTSSLRYSLRSVGLKLMYVF